MIDDPSIYDDPNMLIGDSGVPSQNLSKVVTKHEGKCNENYSPIALRNIFENLPNDDKPGKLGEKAYKEWGKSNQCNRFTKALNYLNQLEPKEIIYLYEQLPTIILGASPKIDSPKYKAFEHQQNYYNATSVWMMRWHSNIIFPQILNSSPYIEYKKDSWVLNREFYLCQMFLDYDSTGFNEIFAPFSLWICMEYAKAVKSFKKLGLTKPLQLSELRTKNTIHNEASNYIDLLKGNKRLELNESNYLRGIKDLFYRLPDFIIWESRKLAENAKFEEEDKELNPEKTFDEYVKSQQTFQNLNINPKGRSRHAIQVYQSKNSEPETYTTKTKLPKSPKTKSRKAKRGFSNC